MNKKTMLIIIATMIILLASVAVLAFQPIGSVIETTQTSTYTREWTEIYQDPELGEVTITVKEFPRPAGGLPLSRQAIIVTPKIPKPGEQTTLKWDGCVPDACAPKLFRGLFSVRKSGNSPNNSLWYTYSDRTPDLYTCTSVTMSFSAPSKVGDYTARYELFRYIDTSYTYTDTCFFEDKNFKVATSTTTCPSNYCSSWTTLGNFPSNGQTFQRSCYTYGSAPTCSESVYQETKIVCNSGYSLQNGKCVSDTPPPPPSSDVYCATCQGNQAIKVPLSSGYSAQVQTETGLIAWFKNLFGTSRESTQLFCEALLTSDGNTLHTFSTNPVCINNEPVADPDFFKPEVKRIWIKNKAGNWVEQGHGTTINTADWRPGTYVDVIVEFSNAGAKNFKEADYTSAERAEMSLATNFISKTFNDVTNFVTFSFIGKVINLFDDPVKNDVIGTNNKQRIDAMPFINVGIAEIGFYGSAASEIAYSNRYSRFSGISVTREETVRRMDSCQGEEHAQGWIQQYMLIVTSPIEGDCWSYDQSSLSHKVFGHQLGGACNIKVQGKIKVPEPNDKLANGVSNYDADGKYYLHAIMFDRCYREDNPTRIYSNVPNIKVQLANAAPTDAVCCKIPGGLFGWFPDYRSITESECTSIKGSPTSNTDKCDLVQKEMCYQCDKETGSIRSVQVFKGECNDDNVLGPLRGWTTNKETANTQCGISSSNTKMCYDCSGVGAEVSINSACPPNFYENNVQAQVCVDSCGGSCASNEKCNFGVCFSNDPSGTNCASENNGFGCYLNQDCIQVENSWTCRTREQKTDRMQCYQCDLSISQKWKVGTELLNVAAGQEILKCNQLFQYTLEQVRDQKICEQKGGSAYINPENENEWCVVSKTGNKKCYPRKDLIELSELPRLDKLSAWDKVSGDYLADKENPVCLNLFGDIQCSEGGVCLPAKNSERKEHKNNKLVYDGLSKVVITNQEKFLAISNTLSTLGLYDLFMWVFDINPKEQNIQQFGVCTFEDQDALSGIKRWIANLFGWDADDPRIIWVMAGFVVFFVLFIYLLTKPPRPMRLN